MNSITITATQSDDKSWSATVVMGDQTQTMCGCETKPQAIAYAALWLAASQGGNNWSPSVSCQSFAAAAKKASTSASLKPSAAKPAAIIGSVRTNEPLLSKAICTAGPCEAMNAST